MHHGTTNVNHMQLREYQAEAIDNLRSSLQDGSRSPLLVMPTGAGKTVVFAEISKRLRKNKHNVLILVHRKELIDQASKKLKAIKVTHGIIAANYQPKNSSIQIASVQTLVRRLNTNKFKPHYIIIDEAHHAAAGSWDKILTNFSDAYRIGCTATPIRLDGRGLKDYFDDLIPSYSISKLIELKYLAPYKVYAPPLKLNLNKVKVLGGDFQKKDLEEKMQKADIVGDAVQQYKKHADGLPAIAFCISVKHAERVCKRFNDAGYKSAIVHGDMPLKQREEVIGGLGNGKIQVLTSVDVISEGTDCPNVSVAILLRATKSEGLYLQQVGRILRPQENKTAIILDHVNATRTHGFVDDDRDWSLHSEKKTKKKGELAPRVETCKKCFAAYKPAPKCPVCGYEAQQRDARFIKEEEGELIELKKQQEKESIKQQQKLLIASAKTMEELEMVAKILGYKKGWAYRVFQSRKLKPRNDFKITKADLQFSEKSEIAKLFVQNKQAYNLFQRLFSPKSKNDDHVKNIDFISKVNMVFGAINRDRPYPHKARHMQYFIEMAKYSWDIAFITNYVNNSTKFRDDLVR